MSRKDKEIVMVRVVEKPDGSRCVDFDDVELLALGLGRREVGELLFTAVADHVRTRLLDLNADGTITSKLSATIDRAIKFVEPKVEVWVEAAVGEALRAKMQEMVLSLDISVAGKTKEAE